MLPLNFPRRLLAAAQHAPDNPLIQALERIEAKQDAIEAKQDAMNARLDNMRRRAHNLRAFGRGSGAELQPLHRELLAAPGGAAPGELPAMAVFPATWQALGQVRPGRSYVALEQGAL